MPASSDQILQVRRWVDDVAAPQTYTDAAIKAIIETYPLLDERGVEPYYFDMTTTPPTKTETPGWYPTYDLHAAAAHIWEEKAAALALDIDCQTESQFGTINKPLTQRRDFAVKQARYHRGRRAVNTVTPMSWPSRNAKGNRAIFGDEI